MLVKKSALHRKSIHPRRYKMLLRVDFSFRTDPGLQDSGTIVKTSPGNHCCKVHVNFVKSADQKGGLCQGCTKCIAKLQLLSRKNRNRYAKEDKKRPI